MFEKGNKLGRKFKPGQSGNPAGAPRKASIVRELEKAVLEEIELKLPGEPKKKRRPFAQLIAEVIVRRAVRGDYRFAKLALEFIDGKPKETAEVLLSTPEEHAAQIHAFLAATRELNSPPQDDSAKRPMVPAPESPEGSSVPPQSVEVQHRAGRKAKLQDGDGETSGDPEGSD